MSQSLIRLILWQIKLVEASVTARQTILVTIIAMNVEFGKAIHAFKLLETIEGYFTGSSDELKKLGLFFLVKAADGAPEPLDLRRGGLVVVVLGVVFPVVDVNVWKTRDEELEFLLIEDCDEFGGDDFVEAYERDFVSIR
jgi:hypothetical protein